METILVVAAIFAAYKLTKYNVIYGGIATLLIILYVFFTKRTDICIWNAMNSDRKGNTDKAVLWFEKARKMKMRINQKLTYASYLMKKGKLTEAEELFKEIFAAKKVAANEYFLAKHNYSYLLLKDNRLDEATAQLEEIFPKYKNSNIYGDLGYLYILQGDLTKAEEFNLEAYDYNSEYATILDNMVLLYTKKNDYQTAYKYVQELSAKKPTFKSGYYNMAVVENEIGEYEDALYDLESAKKISASFLSAVTDEDIDKLYNEIMKKIK